jgi:outer membrane protein TolC
MTRFAAAWLAPVLFCPLLGAAEPSKLTLREAIERMWRDSPITRELEAQVTLAEKDVWRRFLPNEPQISYQEDESDRSKEYGLSLTMGFPGKAFVYAKVDRAALRKQKVELVARKQELAVLVTRAYVECAAAQATIQIREKALGDIETFLQTLKARRGVTQSERLSLELETRQVRRDLLESRDQREVGCKKFVDIVHGGEKEIPPLSLPDDLDRLILGEMGSANADELRAGAAIDYASATYSVASWSQMPDLVLSYGRKTLPAADGSGSPFYNVYGISLTLPLFYPFHESVESRRAKSQAILDRSSAELEKVQIGADRLEAAKTFVRNRNILRDIRSKDLPTGQALLESSYSAYRAGQLGYAEMALSRKTLTDLRLKDVELRSLILNARLKCLDVCETSALDKEVIR